jgi:hypothetical protein
VIDLGEDRGPSDDAGPRYGTRRARGPSGWAVTAVLALLLGGPVAAAAPATPLLREIGDVPVAANDTFAVTAESLLLVHSPDTGTLSAYDLADSSRRWQIPAAGVSYRLRSGGGLVLLRQRGFSVAGGDTVALSAGTGATRWRTPGTVVSVAGSPTVLAVSEVRSLAGAGRRVEGTVLGVDPVTGAHRWSVTVPGTAVLQPVPGRPARAVLVHDDRRAELRDLASGRVLAETVLPAAEYTTNNPNVVGGTLLLRHPAAGGPRVAAYDLATMRLLWSRPASAAYETRVCGPSACLVGRSGVRAVDPVSGAHRWSRPQWQAVEERGGILVAYGRTPDDDGLVGAVDPRDGRLLVDLSRWENMPAADPAGQIVVTRTEPAPGASGQADAPPRIVVGVADPVAGRVRSLGDLPPRAVDCRSTAGRLVCRTDGRLVVWGFPAEP